MKSIFFTMLLVIFGIVPSIHAENIIHDPEYHTMEQVMGIKWEANDKIVQERLAALEKKYGKKPNIIREPDRHFDPAPTLEYKTKKQVNW